MRQFALSFLLLAAHAAFAQDAPKAKLGDPDSMQALTPKTIENCKRMVRGTVGNEVKELIARNGEYVLPVTPKFLAIEFKFKENVMYCYSAKAGNYKTFKPVKLVYFTNYRDYGFYDPDKGLKVLF
jgi:hypothetical protein